MPETPAGPAHEAQRKFTPDGQARPFRGNTIISTVAPDSPLSAMLGSIRQRFAAQRYAHCLTLLPQSSYHMTVFEGVTELGRRAGLWPADLPLDAPLALCQRHMEQALAGFTLDLPLPLRMRATELSAGQHPGAALRLVPFDAHEQARLRDLRDRLADCLRIRAPDHDQYGFHISLGYLLETMSDAEMQAYAATRRACLADVTAACPVIELGAPQFCTFDDMAAFHRRLVLGNGAGAGPEYCR